MEQRYSLRFETGERAGETIPVQGKGFTVGRKPGHALQILDNSVSGKHAEIVVDDRGALLRDLGSTNGTRVGAERILETRLSHGDRITFGNIQMVFLDAARAESGSASGSSTGSDTPGASPGVSTGASTGSAPGAASGGAASSADTMLRVSPEILARSRKRSVVGSVGGWIGLLVLIGAAGGLWYFFHRPAQGGERAVRTARPSAENLLGEEFSFEGETDGWKAAEDAPVAFLKSAQGRYSGAVGLVGDLAEGSWALERSREARVEPGRAIVASAKVKVDGGGVAQVGVELTPPDGADATGPVVAWSKPFDAAGPFGDAEVAAVVPPGYETARLLILGRGQKGGTIAADDAALVARDATAAPEAEPVVVGDWHLALLGDPSTAGVLSRFGRALATGISFSAGTDAAETAQAGRMVATAEAGRVSISSPGRSAFGLRAEVGLVRTGLATIGADGYAAHGLDFERENVTSLLLGKGNELVRVGFSTPVTIKGVAEGQSSRIQVHAAPPAAIGGEPGSAPGAATGSATASPPGAGIGDVVIQLDFAEDRRKAGDIAYAARNAEKKGDLGECLKQWSDLLSGFPYEEKYVAEAEQKRATLVQQGLSELQLVHAEIERARFFRLVDLYRQCRDKAAKVGARFRGSEVDAEAQKVMAEVDQDLVGLEADLAKIERGRLEAILAALDAQKSTGLAAAVRGHLERMPKSAAASGQDSRQDSRH